MKFIPYEYQTKAILKIENEKSVGLLLDMGLGPKRQDSDHADCRR